MKGKTRENSARFEIVDPYRWKCHRSTKANSNPKTKLIANANIDKGAGSGKSNIPGMAVYLQEKNS
jgi:hypothetical protein|tara:strand:+ start:1104 stop:1301 length:198 start_codon:yes stop_codon:yes gene_type:complete